MKQSYSNSKMAAGKAAADLIQDGMYVGLGTGSTAECFIDCLIDRCRNGLRILAAASSEQSLKRAQDGGISMIPSDLLIKLDITVDGADEIDTEKRMIKGGGGALLREKILAVSSKEMVVIVDESKKVNNLGRFPLPVEIIPFAFLSTINRLNQKGYIGKLRLGTNSRPFTTDCGNYIYDIHFEGVWGDPNQHNQTLLQIPGVVETGFFIGIAGRVITGHEDGTVEYW